MKRQVFIFMSLLLCLTLLPIPAAAHESQQPWEEKETVLSALYEADIASIQKALDLGLVTCTELTAYYLERIEEYNEPYNCFITLCDDAMEQAELRDRQLQEGTAEGALFGIPVVVKDNIHVEGWPTTNGYSRKNAAVAKENALIVDRLLEAGAVIVGKTNMSAGAQDARTSRSAAAGETKNAYNTLLAPGGSSGGSAVAVSLNFAAAGLGTDTNSSLRLPAALNGCVSLRVTTKLLPRDGIVKLNGTRDVPGAITRTVEDQARLLDVLSGDGTYLENLNPDVLEGLRIGVLEELSGPVSKGSGRWGTNLSEEVAAAFAAAVEELKTCGAEVVSVSMPSFFALSEPTLVEGGYKKVPRFTAAFEEFLQENQLSAVIFPTYLSEPLRSGTDEEGVTWNVYEQVFLNNCRSLSPSAAVPEITVPIGQHSLGAGIGMEIAGAQYSEQLLLDIAYAYTERFPHRVLPEGAPDLYTEAHGGSMAELTAAYEAFLLAPPEPEIEPEPAPEELPEEQKEDPEPERSGRDDTVYVALCVVPFVLSAAVAHVWRKRGGKPYVPPAQREAACK